MTDNNIPHSAQLWARPEDKKAVHRIEEFIQIVRRLRKECPWDREQTHASLRAALIEEAYECVEAIDSGTGSGDYTELKKELGDVLLHILFHSDLAAEAGEFTLEEVIQTEIDKLIYRHPHVFGDRQVSGSEEVAKNWEQLKRSEIGRNSVLDGVPKSLPSLQRASRIQEKASKVGFDWSDKNSVWKKVREELDEFEKEMDLLSNRNPQNQLSAAETDPVRLRAEQEFGDLLFSLVNYSRHENIDAEGALREATNKFERRFRKLEHMVEASDKPFNEYNLEELDAFWNKVKQDEQP